MSIFQLFPKLIDRCCKNNKPSNRILQMSKRVGMYRIPIFKIWPDLESTGYQTNYPARTTTGYLNTCCTAIFFLLFCVVWMRKILSECVLFSALCSYILQRSTTNMCKRVGVHDSLTTRVQVTSSLKCTHSRVRGRQKDRVKKNCNNLSDN